MLKTCVGSLRTVTYKAPPKSPLFSSNVDDIMFNNVFVYPIYVIAPPLPPVRLVTEFSINVEYCILILAMSP